MEMEQADSSSGQLQVKAYAKGLDAHSSSDTCIPVMVSIKAPLSGMVAERPPVDLVLVLNIQKRRPAPAKWQMLLMEAVEVALGKLSDNDRLAVLADSRVRSARKSVEGLDKELAQAMYAKYFKEVKLMQVSDENCRLVQVCAVSKAIKSDTLVVTALELANSMLQNREDEDKENRAAYVIVISNSDEQDIGPLLAWRFLSVHAFGFRDAHNARTMFAIASRRECTYALLDDERGGITQAFASCIDRITSVGAAIMPIEVKLKCERNVVLETIDAPRVSYFISYEKNAGTIWTSVHQAPGPTKFIVYLRSGGEEKLNNMDLLNFFTVRVKYGRVTVHAPEGEVKPESRKVVMESDEPDGKAMAESDMLDGKVEPESEKLQGTVVMESDELDEKAIAKSDNLDDKVEPESDKVESKVVMDSDEPDGKAMANSDKLDDKVEPMSDKLEGKVVMESDEPNGKTMTDLDKLDGKVELESDKLEGKMMMESDEQDEKAMSELDKLDGKVVMESDKLAGKVMMESDGEDGKAMAELDKLDGKVEPESEKLQGKVVMESDEPDGKAMAESDKLDGRVEPNFAKLESKVVMESDEPDAKAMAKSDNLYDKVEPESDKLEGKVVMESDERDGKVMAELEKTNDKVEPDSDKLEGKLVMESDDLDGKAMTELDKLDGKMELECDKLEGKVMMESDGEDGKAMAELDKLDGKVEPESDKLEGKVLMESDEPDGKAMTELDKLDGKVEPESDKLEGKAVMESDEPDGKAMAELDKLDGKVEPESNKLEGQVMMESDEPDGKAMAESNKLDGKVEPESDKLEGKVMMESDNLDGKPVAKSDKVEGNVLRESEKLDRKVVIGSSKVERKVLAKSDKLRLKVKTIEHDGDVVLIKKGVEGYREMAGEMVRIEAVKIVAGITRANPNQLHLLNLAEELHKQWTKLQNSDSGKEAGEAGLISMLALEMQEMQMRLHYNYFWLEYMLSWQSHQWWQLPLPPLFMDKRATEDEPPLQLAIFPKDRKVAVRIAAPGLKRCPVDLIAVLDASCGAKEKAQKRLRLLVEAMDLIMTKLDHKDRLAIMHVQSPVTQPAAGTSLMAMSEQGRNEMSAMLQSLVVSKPPLSMANEKATQTSHWREQLTKAMNLVRKLLNIAAVNTSIRTQERQSTTAVAQSVGGNSNLWKALEVAKQILVDRPPAEKEQRAGLIIVMSDSNDDSIIHETRRRPYTDFDYIVHAVSFRDSGPRNSRAMNHIAHCSNGIYAVLDDGQDHITDAFTACIKQIISVVAVSTVVTIRCHPDYNVRLHKIQSAGQQVSFNNWKPDSISAGTFYAGTVRNFIAIMDIVGSDEYGITVDITWCHPLSRKKDTLHGEVYISDTSEVLEQVESRLIVANTVTVITANLDKYLVGDRETIKMDKHVIERQLMDKLRRLFHKAPREARDHAAELLAKEMEKLKENQERQLMDKLCRLFDEYSKKARDAAAVLLAKEMEKLEENQERQLMDNLMDKLRRLFHECSREARDAGEDFLAEEMEKLKDNLEKERARMHGNQSVKGIDLTFIEELLAEPLPYMLSWLSCNF